MMKVDDGVMSGLQLEKEMNKLMMAMQSALYSCGKNGYLDEGKYIKKRRSWSLEGLAYKHNTWLW